MSTASVRIRVAALPTDFTFGFSSYRLVVLRAGSSDRARAAMVALLPWNGICLSQIPDIGYLLIPLEIYVSGRLLRARTNLTGGRALVLAGCVRIAVFWHVQMARPMLREMFRP
jgi:hypothetical protein